MVSEYRVGRRKESISWAPVRDRSEEMWTNMNGLLAAQVQGDYSQEPSLGPRPWSKQGGLRWSLWPLLPLRTKQRPVIWVTTWSHVGVQGPHCHGDHANLSGMHSHLGHDDIRAWAATEDHVWVHGPVTVGFCVDVQCPMLAPKAPWKPGIQSSICERGGVRGLCCWYGANVNSQHCHLEPRWHQSPGCFLVPCLGPWSYHSGGL